MIRINLLNFQTVDEIAQTEAAISQLKDTHWEKQRPLKVAQTRDAIQ